MLLIPSIAIADELVESFLGCWEDWGAIDERYTCDGKTCVLFVWDGSAFGRMSGSSRRAELAEPAA